ncbi:hypothetical protein [Methanobrevibacter oralis]|nr:hypothetical protein [Methanobrevibacter oralis]
MKNTEYLEKTWTLTVTYPHENSQEKRKKNSIIIVRKKNHFSKD